MHIVGYLVAAAFLAVSAGQVAAAEAPDAGAVYQIVKATKDRVWRLNKRTGGIAVCSVTGPNLLCTTSTEAIKPPAKTYADLEAERQNAADQAKRKRADERARELASLERIIDAFKVLLREAVEREDVR